MREVDVAKNYLRYVEMGRPLDNAPTGARLLHASVPEACRKMLWEAVWGVAHNLAVPTIGKSTARGWLLSYPQALEKLDDANNKAKKKLTLDEATDQAYRSEYLYLCGIFYKHCREYYP